MRVIVYPSYTVYNHELFVMCQARKTPVPRICLENSHAWNLPGFRQNHKTPTAMAMRAQTSRKDGAFGIFEISETVILGQLYASRLPIPDGFWVVWEGPPYRPHSLGDGSKCHRGKGLKTVCFGPTRTSGKL